MTEDMETQVASGGEQGQATPAASPGADQAPSAIEVDKLVEALLPSIDQAVERKLQSSKDKRIAGLLGKVDDFEAKLARLGELQKSGLSQEDAVWRLRVEDALFAQQTDATPAERPHSGAPASASQAASVDTESILNAMGLDPNSADVVKLLREVRDPVQQIAGFAQLAQKRNQAPAPNAAAVMPTGGGSAASFEDAETLTARLTELQKEPSKNIEEIRKVSAQLKPLLPRL